MTEPGPSLDDLASFGALLAAARRAARGKLSRPSVAALMADVERTVFGLESALQAGTWRPSPYRTFSIRDPKPRTISAAPFADRVVHHAISAAIEPTLEGRFVAESYACRKGKGTHRALARAQALCRRFAYVLKLDVHHFFESADHGVLLERLRPLFPEPRLFDLLRKIVEHGAPGSPPGKGLPIGSLTSQHFANLYLDRADHHLVDTLQVPGYVRYMDDMLLFADDRAALWSTLGSLRRLLADELRLALREEVTRLAPTSEGVPFLGFVVYPGVLRLRGAAVRRLRRGLRGLGSASRRGTIGEEQRTRVAASLLGHAAFGDTLCLRRSLLAGFDHDPA